MKTLYVGFIEDSVELLMHSMAIRIAYFLSTQFRISGNITFSFEMEEALRSMSYEQKLKFIDDREKDSPNPSMLYQQYREHQKMFKKAGKHQKELLVIHKKMEIMLNKYFNNMVDDMVQMANNSGILSLKPIQDSSYYGEYYISYGDVEKESKCSSKLSDILQLNLDEDDNKAPAIFFLNYPFFLTDFNRDNNMLPQVNEFSENGFLQEIYTFHNYNDFSIADLNTIRFEVNESLHTFQDSVNGFTALSEDPAAAFTYLQNDVVIAAKNLAENINKTGLVANYNKIMQGVPYRGILYLGMLPRHLIFKYFEFIKAAREDTMAILNKLPDDEQHQFLPVLITRIEDINIAGDENNFKKEELLPLKKSLSID